MWPFNILKVKYMLITKIYRKIKHQLFKGVGYLVLFRFVGGKAGFAFIFVIIYISFNIFSKSNVTVCVGTPVLCVKTVPEILPLLSCITSTLMLLPEGAVSGIITLMSKWDLLGVLCVHQVAHQMCILCL